MNQFNASAAAHELLRQHAQGERFDALQRELALHSAAQAYAVQDEYVRELIRCRATTLAGWKIALTTPAMREMVDFHDSISGRLLRDQIRYSGAVLQGSNYGRLVVEFEIAFEMARDLPRVGTPWTGVSILEHVACGYAALEIADDRHADYATLRQSILTLAADNAWNQGLVLGTRFACNDFDSLACMEGVACIDAQQVGRGFGRDVLGNPCDALAWLANHIAERGEVLKAGSLVTTGSLVKSQFPVAGQRVEFVLTGIGSVSLQVA